MKNSLRLIDNALFPGFRATGLSFSHYLSRINAYLLVALGFLMILSVSAGTIAAIVITILWILQGNLQSNIAEFKQNRIALAFAGFYTLNVLGLLWTEDIQWGLHMLGKQWKILLMPVLMTSMKKEHTEYYIHSFIFGMAVTHIVSYLSIFGIIDFTLMGHVSYNVLLAFCLYIVLYYLLFHPLSNRRKFIFLFLFLSMSVNMFVTIGRMGQLAYFAMLIVILFQYFSKNRIKALLISCTLIPLLFVLFYHVSTVFKSRMDAIVDEVVNFEMNKPSKYVNDRITFYINSIELIKENPLFGLGTGDFSKEYNRINQSRTPKVVTTVNPHNNYLLVLAQFGLSGLTVFLSIFYFQIKCALSDNMILRHLKLGLPLFFMIIMFTDSYLLGHDTAIVFSYFSAFLYKDCHTIHQQ